MFWHPILHNYFYHSRNNLSQGNVESESTQNPIYENQGEIFRNVKVTGFGSAPPPLPPACTEKSSTYQQQPHSVHVKENTYEIPQEIYENQQAYYDANLPLAMPPGNVLNSLTSMTSKCADNVFLISGSV